MIKAVTQQVEERFLASPRARRSGRRLAAALVGAPSLYWAFMAMTADGYARSDWYWLACVTTILLTLWVANSVRRRASMLAMVWFVLSTPFNLASLEFAVTIVGLAGGSLGWEIARRHRKDGKHPTKPSLLALLFMIGLIAITGVWGVAKNIAPSIAAEFLAAERTAFSTTSMNTISFENGDIVFDIQDFSRRQETQGFNAPSITGAFMADNSFCSQPTTYFLASVGIDTRVRRSDQSGRLYAEYSSQNCN